MIPIEHVIALATALFSIGVIGAVLRRNLIAVLISLQLMQCAAVLALVAFNRVWWGSEAAPRLDGQVLALLVIVVAAAQLALGIAVVLALVRNRDSLDARSASLLRW